MRKILTFCVFLMVLSVYGQVGIGTVTPDSSAVLDLESANKGFMLPRLNDTTSVSNPGEGLMIYNKNDKKPYFFDGGGWQGMGVLMPSSTDSLTYQLTMSTPGYTTTELPLQYMSVGGSAPYGVTLNVTKSLDLNSTYFFRSFIVESPIIEITYRCYKKGSSTPYVSYISRNNKIASYAGGIGKGIGYQSESFTLVVDEFGFKALGATGGFIANFTSYPFTLVNW